MWQRGGECNQCGACCESINFTVVRDITLRQHGNIEELRRYLEFRGIRLVGEDIENNYLFYSMEVPCQQLNEDKSCKVHNTPQMPFLCLRYPREPDDIEDCSYEFRRIGASLPGLPQK